MTDNRTTPTTSARISFTELPDTATITELTEFCHKHHINLTVKGLTRKGAPKVNPEGEVTVFFTDLNKSVTLPNPKAARKWLRKKAMTVTAARKEADRWIFLKASAAVTLYFKQQ